jgi:hypothetical protein
MRCKFKYMNNKKSNQPRYQCLECKYFFTHTLIHKRPYGRNYAKKRLVDPLEVKGLHLICSNSTCGAVNHARFMYYNNNNKNQPRFQCLSCKKQFQAIPWKKKTQRTEKLVGDNSEANATSFVDHQSLQDVELLAVPLDDDLLAIPLDDDLLAIPLDDDLLAIPLDDDLLAIPLNDDLLAIPLDDDLLAIPLDDDLLAIPLNDNLLAIPLNDDLLAFPPHGHSFTTSLLEEQDNIITPHEKMAFNPIGHPGSSTTMQLEEEDIQDTTINTTM